MNIIECLQDSKLLGASFKDLSTWATWLTVLRALFGLGLTEEELPTYYKITGRTVPPEGRFKELWLVKGRRIGFSTMMGAASVFLALFYDFSKYLSPGELGVIQIVAADRAQAGVVFRYLQAFLHGSEPFKRYIVRETRDTIELSARISIEVTTANPRTLRGRSCVAFIGDECAHWLQDGSNPDSEIIAAARPATATIPESFILMGSSPRGSIGTLYEHHKTYYGKNDAHDILVIQSDTRTFNPLMPESLIEREIEKDSAAGMAEWYGVFRKDLETFLPLSWIESAIVRGRKELAPEPGLSYMAFCDPSGGAQDAMTLAIGHRDGERMIQDVLRWRTPPFNVHAAVKEFSAILKEYRVSEVRGDRYSGNWCAEAFKQEGIRYTPSIDTASELYLSTEPLLGRGSCELVDNPELCAQFRSLERRVGRNNRDAITHPPRAHDDLANATAGLMVNLSKLWPGIITFDWLEKAENRAVLNWNS